LERYRAVALGFFDGVHRGHAALLRRCRETADALGVSAAVMTFDLHPDTLVTGAPVPLLNTPEDRAGLMRRLCGIDEVLFCHFDRAMMEMPWREFVCGYLVRELGAAHVVCGHDFRFGWHGEGTAALLAEEAARLSIGCDVIGQVEEDGIVVSSTYIRSLVAAGDMARATRFLGHPHVLTGPVVHGRALGRTLGIPTANLALPDGLLAPAFGVYAAEAVTADGARRPAVVNVGDRPTVGGGKIWVEAWLLDFQGNLYGQPLRLEFHRFLRPERKFSSLEAMRAEILRNAEETRTIFGG